MIALREVSKRFGAVSVLERVSLELPAGSTTAILGPSGIGKTTLLRLIAGLEAPDEGQIEIGGKLASRPDWLRPPNRRGVGLVFQAPALWPHMTVAQNVAFGLHGRPRDEIGQRVAEALAQMELDGLAGRTPAQLSGGQARRVSIARTLVTRPKRLLLDEPFTHLDVELRARLLALIADYAAREGATLLLVTHDAVEAAQLAGRLLKLVDGRLTESEEAR